MLIRLFRGRVHQGMEQRYARYLRDVAAPHILSTPGVRELQIFEPLRSQDDFVVKSVWTDVGSLIAFAGKDWSHPRILPTERDFLAAADVTHHRIGSRYDASATACESRRVTVDPAAGIAKVDGHIYELPPLEARILAELVSRAGRYIDPAELARSVWRGSTAIAPNDVRRSMYRLRRLIEDDRRADPVVRNKRGFGYMLDE